MTNIEITRILLDITITELSEKVIVTNSSSYIWSLNVVFELGALAHPVSYIYSSI